MSTIRWNRETRPMVIALGPCLALAMLIGCEAADSSPPAGEARSSFPVPAESGPRPPAVQFVDGTRAVGIHFQHENAAAGEKLLPETMGSGCAFFDYDGDGHPDLLLLNQRSWPNATPGSQSGPVPTQALYRNDGEGRFQDVTREAGLDVPLFGMGAVVGDYDNDGDPDLYITTLHGGRLYRNDGGRFADVTEEADARGGEGWLTSGAFFDMDNDGDLDLFLCEYLGWSPEYDRAQNFQLVGGDRAYGPPSAFSGTFCVLLRNDGGRFTDVGEESGIRVRSFDQKAPMAKSLGVAPWDIDEDGLVDLAVANDTTPNFLFHNLGGGRFEEIATISGVAFDSNGLTRGAMGIDWARFLNDGTLGLAIGNFANEMTALYVSEDPDHPLFSDQANLLGLGAPTQTPLQFGVFWFDYDNDGRQDLLSINGHLEPEIARSRASLSYQQPAQLFWNSGQRGPRLFVPVSPDLAGGDLFRPIVGRGGAYADIDGDGDLDLVLTENGGPARLFRNEGGSRNHWVRLRLIGRPPGSNRDAIGARLTLQAGSLVQHRQHFPAKGYLSSVEFPLTFGLGQHGRVDQLTIRWPSGRVSEHPGLAVDRLHTIEEPDGPR